MRDDFAVFILTHGRADHVVTYNTLKRMNYTGKIIILIDDEDSQADRYRLNFSNMPNTEVVQFDKKARARLTQTADNLDERNSVIYARNECFAVAQERGLSYFLELDDDYGGIYFRYPKDGILKADFVQDFDSVCESMIRFLDSSKACTVCFAQGGDFIGGLEKYNNWGNKSRKAMNSFFCCTARPFNFLGRMNDDVNSYVTLGSRGHLFWTIKEISVNPAQTQAVEGGLTDMYLKYGTYVKSYYAVIFNPSCVKVDSMGWTRRRIHHKVYFDNAVPKILSENIKKSDNIVTPICKEYMV